jgi:death-on-curing protein
LKDR